MNLTIALTNDVVDPLEIFLPRKRSEKKGDRQSCFIGCFRALKGEKYSLLSP